ncbi:MAG: SGNH/GDSL hydrolase family protein [Lachnospiraceae bacterium]|nr:SGNH/GDSL hydrolase family protein [Lachnospiraceae bacterium]
MKRIMCYGDSNTWGYNPNKANPITGALERYPEHVRWTGVMADMLGDGYRVLEEGYCGRTTVFDDPLAYGRNGFRHLEVAFKTCDPVDLVIIMLGTNDEKDMFSTDPYIIYNGMLRLVCELKNLMADSNSPDAKIMIVNPARLTPCKDGSFTYGFSQKSIDMADGLKKYYRQLADEMKCEFFDADAIASVDPADGTHLTPDGHKALGQAMAEKVRKILE